MQELALQFVNDEIVKQVLNLYETSTGIIQWDIKKCEKYAGHVADPVNHSCRQTQTSPSLV